MATRAKAMEDDAGHAIWPGVLGPFDFSLPLAPIKDTANTDLVYFQGQLMALWYEKAGVEDAVAIGLLGTHGQRKYEIPSFLVFGV